MRLAENVLNSEVIFAEIKAWAIRADVPCCVTTSSPNVKWSVKKNSSLRNSAWIPAPARRGEVEVEVAGQRCKVNFAVNRWGSPAVSMSSPHQNRMLSILRITGSRLPLLRWLCENSAVDNQKAAVLKNNNGKVVFNSDSCCWPTTITSCHGHAVHAGQNKR